MESCGRSMLGPKRGVVIKGFLVAQIVKDAHAVLEAQVSSLGREDPLGKEKATHSSMLAWDLPWTEEPGRLQSMRLQNSWT